MRLGLGAALSVQLRGGASGLGGISSHSSWGCQSHSGLSDTSTSSCEDGRLKQEGGICNRRFRVGCARVATAEAGREEMCRLSKSILRSSVTRSTWSSLGDDGLGCSGLRAHLSCEPLASAACSPEEGRSGDPRGANLRSSTARRRRASLCHEPQSGSTRGSCRRARSPERTRAAVSIAARSWTKRSEGFFFVHCAGRLLGLVLRLCM